MSLVGKSKDNLKIRKIKENINKDGVKKSLQPIQLLK
jgi:hypothetical protein